MLFEAAWFDVAPQRFEATWSMRPARARRAVTYVSRCETLADPYTAQAACRPRKSTPAADHV